MSHPATANLSEAANGLLFEVLEYVEGSAHFARIKSFSNTKKFTVTKVTPYYGEGIYGEMPTNNEPAKYLTPIAELEVTPIWEIATLLSGSFSPLFHRM